MEVIKMAFGKKKGTDNIENEAPDDLLAYWDSEYDNGEEKKKKGRAGNRRADTGGNGDADLFDDEDSERKGLNGLRGLRGKSMIIAIIACVIAVVAIGVIAMNSGSKEDAVESSVEETVKVSDELLEKKSMTLEKGKFTCGVDFMSGKYSFEALDSDKMIEIMIRSSGGRLIKHETIGGVAGKNSVELDIPDKGSVEVSGNVKMNRVEME